MKRCSIMLLRIACLVLAVSHAHAEQSEIKTGVYDYWDNGNPRECRRYDLKGNLMQKCYFRDDGTLEHDERFDMYDHKVEESHYNQDGTLRENADGWAAMRWKYVDGNLAVQSYYGENGHIKKRKLYSEGGNLIATQYVGDDSLDRNEEFVSRPLSDRETVRFYDSSGRLIGVAKKAPNQL